MNKLRFWWPHSRDKRRLGIQKPWNSCDVNPGINPQRVKRRSQVGWMGCRAPLENVSQCGKGSGFVPVPELGGLGDLGNLKT